MSSALPRLVLARLPTPLERADRLGAAWGGPTIWIKRDDLTGFGLSGNKIRKLEFHLAAATAAGADTVITCGAAQSNHCRATSLAAARLGLQCRLVLRTPDGRSPGRLHGNLLLDRLAGAAVRYVDPEGYAARDDVMADEAAAAVAEGRTPWVIPEGASDALGMLGFVAATEELADQMAKLEIPGAAIWHPTSSGGTTAGIVGAVDRGELPSTVIGVSVGEGEAEVRERVTAIFAEAAARDGGPAPATPYEVLDGYVGRGYGQATPAELATQAEATALTGLLFDPTYTGKALYALRSEIAGGRFGAGDHVVFWHTGGGFAVFAHDYSDVLAG